MTVVSDIGNLFCEQVEDGDTSAGSKIPEHVERPRESQKKKKRGRNVCAYNEADFWEVVMMDKQDS